MLHQFKIVLLLSVVLAVKSCEMDGEIARLKESRKAYKASLTRKKNEIRELMMLDDCDYIEEVRRKESELDHAMTKFNQAQDAYDNILVDEEERNESFRYSQAETAKLYDFKELMLKWCRRVEIDPTDSISNVASRISQNTRVSKASTRSPTDAISNVASRVSQNSRVSKTSTSSRSSQATDAMLRAAAKRAVLAVEVAALDEKQALAQQKFLISQQEARLKLVTEMARAKAEEKVYKEFENGNPENIKEKSYLGWSSNNRDIVSSTDRPLKKPQTPTVTAGITQTSPFILSSIQQQQADSKSFTPWHVPMPVIPSVQESIPNPFVPKPHAPLKIERKLMDQYDDDDEQRKKTDNGSGVEVLKSIQMVQQQVERQLKQQRLPKAELMSFDGDPLNYFLFMKSFENNVEKSTFDSSERLQILMQYCTGKARQVIKSCGMMDADVGFHKAKRLLAERFGDKYTVTNAWIHKVSEGPMIKISDREALQDLVDDLENCEITLKVTGRLHQINNEDRIIKILQRLPVYIKSRWQKLVQDIREQGRDPNIQDLKILIKAVAKEKNDPVFGGIMDSTYKDESARARLKKNISPRVSKYNFSIQSDSKAPDSENLSSKSLYSKNYNSNVRWRCFLCRGDHRLENCEEFQSKTSDEKLNFVRERKLCENCISSNHYAGGCKIPNNCKVQDCTFNRKHLGSLHQALLAHRQEWQDRNRSLYPGMDSSSGASSGKVRAQGRGEFVGNINHICSETKALPIVPVKVKAKGNNKVVKVYALLDSGSTSTWCSSKLIKKLDAKGSEIEISLTTIEKQNSPISTTKVSLEIMDVDENVMIELPEVFSSDKLNISSNSIARKEDVRRWPHLQGIMLHDNIGAEVELLIGQDVPAALEPEEIKGGQGKGPYATKTKFGWTLNGPLGRYAASKTTQANAITSEELLNRQFHQYMNLEFNDSTSESQVMMSRNDKQAITMFENSVCQIDGHYEIGIPWIDDPALPNNKPLAEHRLRLLKKKLLKDEELLRKYSMFMTDLFEKNYARKVPEHLLSRNDGKVWYLPHHSVIHQTKPDKVRIVFDCAAKYRGVSLNDKVLQGPDLANKLLGVLTRFRQEPYALMADVEAMYHQVRVNLNDVDALRFLWFPNNDPGQESEVCQMLVHIFGGVWSPSCANFSLLQTAKDNAHQFDAEIAETVQRNFYVDDCLKCAKSEEHAVKLVDQLSKMLACGGFHLTKWVSNSRKVLHSIPVSKQAKGVKDLDLDKDLLPIERALGVRWNIETDEFTFMIRMKDKPPTRRGLLSIISSVYDPLGFTCPFILPAKSILQELSRMKLHWDEVIPDEMLTQWRRWQNELPKLEEFSVYRCFKPLNFGNVVQNQLHHFADASEVGYGAVSYLRQVNEEGNVNCSFVIGKSRVTPLKPMSIPRLELSAAVVAVRLDQVIQRELDIPVNQSVFWTDSTAVLCYIENCDKRFQTFVANRLGIIHDSSTPEQWRHVDGKSNPADNASRGLSADSLLTNESWIKGPKWLWQDEQEWPKRPAALRNISNNDPEIKTETQVHCSTYKVTTDVIDRMLRRYSSWDKLKRNVAWLLRYRSWLLIKSKHRLEHESKVQLSQGRISVDEMQIAEQEILKYVQKQHFGVEMSSIAEEGVANIKNARKSSIKKSSSVYSLDPILINGLLRVGGRLKRAQLSLDAKHPIILPKNHHVVDLIVRHYHSVAGHSGQEYVLSLIRQRFWVIKGRVTVRKILRSCFICKRRQQRPGQQKMADLPADRVTPDKPPFTYVGVDCFGPFSVKRGRSIVKRYGVIFTCLIIRAVHVEVAHSLDTSSFINALRRFIAR